MNLKVIKIGNEHGVIFDAALLRLANLKEGLEFSAAVSASGAIVLTPLRSRPPREEVSKVIQSTMKAYARTMKSLG